MLGNETLIPYPHIRFSWNSISWFPRLRDADSTAPLPQQGPPSVEALRQTFYGNGYPDSSLQEHKERWLESIHGYHILRGRTGEPSAFWPVHQGWFSQIPMPIEAVPPVTTTPPSVPVSVEAAEIPETLEEVVPEEGHAMSLTPGGESIGHAVSEGELLIREYPFDLIDYIDGSGSSMSSAQDGRTPEPLPMPPSEEQPNGEGNNAQMSGNESQMQKEEENGAVKSTTSPSGTQPSLMSCMLGNVSCNNQVSIPSSHGASGISSSLSPTAAPTRSSTGNPSPGPPPPRKQRARYTARSGAGGKPLEHFYKSVLLDSTGVSPVPNGTVLTQTVRDYISSLMENQSGASSAPGAASFPSGTSSAPGSASVSSGASSTPGATSAPSGASSAFGEASTPSSMLPSTPTDPSNDLDVVLPAPRTVSPQPSSSASFQLPTGGKVVANVKKMKPQKRGRKRKLSEDAEDWKDNSPVVLTYRPCALGKPLCFAGEFGRRGGIVTSMKCQACRKSFHACCVRLSTNVGPFVCCGQQQTEDARNGWTGTTQASWDIVKDSIFD